MHLSVHNGINSSPCFKSSAHNCAAELTRRAVSIFCLYHVVLGSRSFLSFFFFFLYPKCLKVLRAGEQSADLFLLCSVWVSSASDWSWDKHMSYISSGSAEAGFNFLVLTPPPPSIKVNLCNWINIFDLERSSSKSRSQTTRLLLKETSIEHW